MNYDVVRGVLILVVILDHNDIVRNVRAVNQWFLPMTFHVAGFLLLPFLVKAKKFSIAIAADHAIRYLTPFSFALVLYSVAFHVLVTPQMPFADWLAHLAAAFVLASPVSLHEATGFIVLWFLPALLSLVLLSAAYNVMSRFGRMTMLCLALATHLSIGSLSQSIQFMVPQGLLVAIYIFPLGVTCRRLVPWLAASRHRVLIVSASLATLLACWISERGSEIEVATLILPTILQPVRVLVTDVSDVAFLVILVASSRFLGGIPILASLGRLSLVIYLIHPIIYKPIFWVLLHWCKPMMLQRPGGPLIYWSGALASVVIVTGMSLGVAEGIQAWPLLRRMVTPRGRGDWFVLVLWERVRQHQTAQRSFGSRG